jgi:hypothetical protein
MTLTEKLTATVGTLMVQTGKMQTYQDAIEAMLNRSVILPSELLAEIEKFIETNKHLGFTTREEFGFQQLQRPLKPDRSSVCLLHTLRGLPNLQQD